MEDGRLEAKCEHEWFSITPSSRPVIRPLMVVRIAKRASVAHVGQPGPLLGSGYVTPHKRPCGIWHQVHVSFEGSDLQMVRTEMAENGKEVLVPGVQ